MKRLLLGLIALAACDAAPPEVLATRTDSAGVEVVVSSAPRVDTVQSVLGETLLSLASDENEFYSVTDFVRFGSLYVVAERTRIRAFTADGSPAWDFGRDGDGPQEFRFISDLLVRGDSLAILDQRTRRVSLLSSEGAWIRSIPLPPERLTGPTFVSISEERFGIVSTARTQFDLGGPTGRVRTPQTLLAVSWDDGSEAELLTLKGEESIREEQGQGVTMWRPLFGRQSWVFPVAGGVGVAEAEFRGYEVHSEDGDVVRRVSAPFDPTLEREMIDAEWDARVRVVGPAATDNLRERTTEPDSIPATDRVIATRAGEVWMRRPLGEYRSNAGPGPHTWDVFSADSWWAGTVTTPLEFRVTEVWDDVILGVRKDDLDVEHPEVRRRN